MKILMNHIPKCAGNAVVRQFEAMLGTGKTYEIRTNGGIESVPDLSPYAFVFGHLPLDWEETFSEGRQRFSIVRNPIDRVLSAYFFFDQLQNDKSAIVAEYPRMTLEQYIFSEDPLILATTCNEKARHLLGLEGEGTRNAEEAKMFVKEREKLLDRFFTIGVYERLQDSLDAVSWSLHLPRMRASLVDNPTHRKWKQETFDQKVIDAIRERNMIDLELYRVVSERFAFAHEMIMEALISAQYFETVQIEAKDSCTVEMSGPVMGGGWYGAETAPEGVFRWMGGRDGASLYFPIVGGNEMAVQAEILSIVPGLQPEDIMLYLNGYKLHTELQCREATKWLLTGVGQNVPLRKGCVLTIRTRTWRQPTVEDGRTLALAVSRVEISKALTTSRQ